MHGRYRHSDLFCPATIKDAFPQRNETLAFQLRRRMCGVALPRPNASNLFRAMPPVRALPTILKGRARTRGAAQRLEPGDGGAEPAPHIRRQSRSERISNFETIPFALIRGQFLAFAGNRTINAIRL